MDNQVFYESFILFARVLIHISFAHEGSNLKKAYPNYTRKEKHPKLFFYHTTHVHIIIALAPYRKQTV
jgi:hypothetical protein